MVERVLVLGGGLAGVACAKELGEAEVDVTLVDHNDYHQFQPLLYQVASSQLPAEDIARPHVTIFREHATVDVVNAHVSTADLSARSLTLADGETLQGSHLVMAAGARPNFFGVPGAAEHAFALPAARTRACLRGEFSLPRLRACVGGLPVGAVRASVGLPTTPADIDRLVGCIEDLTAGRASRSARRSEESPEPSG